jgi:hypothetical protein
MSSFQRLHSSRHRAQTRSRARSGSGLRGRQQGAARVRVGLQNCRDGIATHMPHALVMPAGALSSLADSNGLAAGWLWICWQPGPAARIAMGPRPDRGAAAEAYSFGTQMAGMPSLSAIHPRTQTGQP